MATLDVPDKYLACAPVIVTSPAPRCGTTIVQRLLTASTNGFIYGEEIGSQMKTLTGLFFGQLQVLEQHGQKMDADFADALSGHLQKWRPILTAPAAVMRKGWTETYYQLPFALALHSEAVGRPVWGFKYPSYSRDLIQGMLSVLPRARVVYVFRNLPDVLKSAKARRFVTTPEQTAEFCAAWAKNLSEAAALAQDQRVLFLKYEALLERPAEHLQLLELFTGVRGIDAGELAVKINTFKGETAAGHAPSQYIEPAELTETDLALIDQHAGAVMAGLYSDAPTETQAAPVIA
jgi:hypothetical protein